MAVGVESSQARQIIRRANRREFLDLSPRDVEFGQEETKPLAACVD